MDLYRFYRQTSGFWLWLTRVGSGWQWLIRLVDNRWEWLMMVGKQQDHNQKQEKQQRTWQTKRFSNATSIGAAVSLCQARHMKKIQVSKIIPSTSRESTMIHGSSESAVPGRYGCRCKRACWPWCILGVVQTIVYVHILCKYDIYTQIHNMRTSIQDTPHLQTCVYLKSMYKCHKISNSNMSFTYPILTDTYRQVCAAVKSWGIKIRSPLRGSQQWKTLLVGGYGWH